MWNYALCIRVIENESKFIIGSNSSLWSFITLIVYYGVKRIQLMEETCFVITFLHRFRYWEREIIVYGKGKR
jgi:hypothetical protein